MQRYSTLIIKYLKQEQEPKFYIEFLEVYAYYFNRILLAVAVNDQQLISYNIRSMLEQLMKFIYSTQYSLPIKTIRDTSFRHLKEDLMNSSIKHETVDKIVSYYGAYSKMIHDKDSTNINIEYLEDVISSKHKELIKLPDILKNILDIFYEIMEQAVDIDKKILATGEKIMLRHNLNQKRLAKINKYLFYV